MAIYLPVGKLITKIDDTSMASASLDDPWDRYLLSPSSDSLHGWCTDKSLLNQTSGEWAKRLVGFSRFSSTKALACAGIGPYSCFVSKMDETEQYELDPLLIFTVNLPRCNSSIECSSSSSCVAPRHDQQLVRISVLIDYGTSSSEHTIVWKGPKKEIWEQGTQKPPNPSRIR